MQNKIYLSLVVPVYKQEKTIVKNIHMLQVALNDLKIKYELILVADGSISNLTKILKKNKSKGFRLLGYEENQGKGYAVRYGMRHAKGEVIGFIDAGMDIAKEGIAMLLQHMDWYKADIIVGSKLHPVSYVKYPFSRRILSWGYRTLTRILFGFKVRDSQVGIKLFKRKVVKKIFPKLLVKKFAFDIEVLAVAYNFGFTRIYEAPVKLNFKQGSISSKNFWKISLHMLWDTIAVWYRIKILNHYKKTD